MGWRNIWIQRKFHKIYKEDSALGYFIEADVQQTEKLHELHSDLPFFPGWIKIEKIGKLTAKCIIKKNMLYT